MWASEYAALQRLSGAMRKMIEFLSAVHKRFDMDATHPIVRTHPKTGRKALYVNRGFPVHFAGMSIDGSKPLLDRLVKLGSTPDLKMRHSWQAESVMMWNDGCVTQFAIQDHGDAQRDMHRVTVSGEQPR